MSGSGVQRVWGSPTLNWGTDRGTLLGLFSEPRHLDGKAVHLGSLSPL